MSSSSVENKVGKAIQESQEFAAIKETSSFDKQIATNTESQAQAAIGQADSMTQMLQMQRDEVNQQVLNPPMKEVSAGGKSGGMKSIVDNEELGKLQSQLKALDGQLADATNKAEAARGEASEATVRRVELSAAEEEAASGEALAQAKASTIRTALAGSERDDLQEGAKGLNDEQLLKAYGEVVAQNAATNNGKAAEVKDTKAESGETASPDKKVNASTASTSSNTD